MKASLFLIPVLLVAVFVYFYWWSPSTQIEPVESQSAGSGSAVTRVATPQPNLIPTTERAEALERELAAERSRRMELESAVGGLDGDVVVSLGKIGEIGGQVGRMLTTQNEWKNLSEKARTQLSPEENQRLSELERMRAAALGALPEIASFQDNPEEYGQFFRGVFQQAGNLNDAEAGKIEDYMKGRSERMVEQGLNNGREPEDPAEESAWESRRDVFNEETTDGLVEKLPAGMAGQIGLDDSLLELLEGDFDKAGALTR